VNATFKTVMLWMSLLVVIFLAWHFANIQKKEAPLSFSAFMEEVEQGKIAEVSAELGFSAQSNFTRFFLNQVGVPPSEYRRAASRPETEDSQDPKPDGQ